MNYHDSTCSQPHFDPFASRVDISSSHGAIAMRVGVLIDSPSSLKSIWKCLLSRTKTFKTSVRSGFSCLHPFEHFMLIHSLVESIIKRVWREAAGMELITPFPRITYHYAMTKVSQLNTGHLSIHLSKRQDVCFCDYSTASTNQTLASEC